MCLNEITAELLAVLATVIMLPTATVGTAERVLCQMFFNNV